MKTDFYHKKVIPFENYLAINFNYEDIDIILKGLELFSYNLKNVYLMKEDNFAIKEKSYKISLLYNLILSSYTLHIDNILKKNEEEEKKQQEVMQNKYYRFKVDTRQLRSIINKRKGNLENIEEVKIG